MGERLATSARCMDILNDGPTFTTTIPNGTQINRCDIHAQRAASASEGTDRSIAAAGGRALRPSNATNGPASSISNRPPSNGQHGAAPGRPGAATPVAASYAMGGRAGRGGGGAGARGCLAPARPAALPRLRPLPEPRGGWGGHACARVDFRWMSRSLLSHGRASTHPTNRRAPSASRACTWAACGTRASSPRSTSSGKWVENVLAWHARRAAAARASVSQYPLPPTHNTHRYGLFYTYLDLDQLDGTFWGMWPLASHSRLAPAPTHAPSSWRTLFSLAHFWEGDHLKDVPVETDPSTGQPLPLVERVRRLVQAATGVRPEGRVCLLTHLRYLGYVFNPVSFYYVWDKEVRVFVFFCFGRACLVMMMRRTED